LYRRAFSDVIQDVQSSRKEEARRAEFNIVFKLQFVWKIFSFTHDVAPEKLCLDTI
jgi:hypothetical protein